MNIIYFKQLDSTNAYAKENIEKLEDKTVISTDIQTDGHGRFKRKWVDLGTENIYMTFVLKPSETLSDTHADLTRYLSVCVCKILEESGLAPKIKYPNDILINKKKLCGILAETAIKGGKSKGIALGIGINLNVSKENIAQINIPATSVNLELGRHINKKEFMNNLINIFFADYEEFLKVGFDLIKNDYGKRLIEKNTAS